jgi:hypothetical protein
VFLNYKIQINKNWPISISKICLFGFSFELLSPVAVENKFGKKNCLDNSYHMNFQVWFHH